MKVKKKIKSAQSPQKSVKGDAKPEVKKTVEDKKPKK